VYLQAGLLVFSSSLTVDGNVASGRSSLKLIFALEQAPNKKNEAKKNKLKI
jgi:hypothetical protein